MTLWENKPGNSASFLALLSLEAALVLIPDGPMVGLSYALSLKAIRANLVKTQATVVRNLSLDENLGLLLLCTTAAK